MIREPDDRHVRVRVRNLVGVDARDVGDHELGPIDTVSRDEMVAVEKRFELAPEEEVDPTEQDRRHGPGRVTLHRVVEEAYAEGIALARAGRYFDAHEAFETAWRAADEDERDFFQGLVHVVVAWYQDGRGNRTGCERQLAKARRRLARYAPAHRGLDVAAVLAQVDGARFGQFADLELPQAQRIEDSAQADVQPPLAVEEEQQPERDQHGTADDA